MTSRRLRLWGTRLVLAALVFDLTWLAYVSPLWQRFDIEREIADLDQRAPDLQRLANTGPGYRATLEAIERQTADSFGADTSADAIEAAARSAIEATGGTVQSLRLKPSEAGYSATIAVDLPPDTLEAWLAGLEYGKPPFLMRSLDIRRLTEADSGGDQLEVKASGDWMVPQEATQ
ncbi:hypothetical protein [Oryzibacter oryziterrae]|uniref:hypothetical protein n=1 Tax=Oryzibacter oryziterrae TaxID=2766474 RepID=UPI001F2CF444|nr:hypothetical protein [Oryzibacter oryziterrae]